MILRLCPHCCQGQLVREDTDSPLAWAAWGELLYTCLACARQFEGVNLEPVRHEPVETRRLTGVER